MAISEDSVKIVETKHHFDFLLYSLDSRGKRKRKEKKMFISYNNSKINAKIETYNDTILLNDRMIL